MNVTNPVIAVHYYQDKKESGNLVEFVRLNRTRRKYTPNLNSRGRMFRAMYGTGITLPNGGYWFTHLPTI